ncbi:MAG: GFA family protein [Gammaproteobacteria bacterium]|nr:GFA family protein [Gammaproteobacteria bacterium]
MTEQYRGSCHCGAIRFSFASEAITSALRCTCSICSRKGAMMTPFVVPLADMQVEVEDDALGLYEFDTRIAKHYFCKRCGIYTHNETARFPGQCRINLGCIEDLDTSDFEVAIFDGKNLL